MVKLFPAGLQELDHALQFFFVRLVSVAEQVLDSLIGSRTYIFFVKGVQEMKKKRK